MVGMRSLAMMLLVLTSTTVTSPDELVPAFFAVNAAREIVWQQRGRADGNYGDGELLKYLGCAADADLQA